jgi:DNA end-binding protein Ku
MPPHSIGSGTISFGLVSIPVRMYTAASSSSISFNLLHEKCGSRIKQQQMCPACNEVLERSALVKGYEFSKDQYVRLTEDEIKALEDEGTRMIDIEEFVPLEQVDPIYFEKAYYLGPDKGGEKAYRLLSDAMGKTSRVALAKFVMRGKQSLVLIRPSGDGLMLHTMYYSDEVRDFGEIGKGEDASIKSGELDLASRLIDELSSETFKPDQYRDDYREKVVKVIESKIEGKEITAVGPQVQRTQVIDLMDALKQSLEKRGSSSREAEANGPVKKPAVKAKRVKAETETKERKVGGKR